jgi:hypothetical protein
MLRNPTLGMGDWRLRRPRTQEPEQEDDSERDEGFEQRIAANHSGLQWRELGMSPRVLQALTTVVCIQNIFI